MIIGNPLTLGGGGGGFPVTVRHCGANAIVTAYSGGKTERTTANADGVAVFEKLAKGVWVFACANRDSVIAEIASATEVKFFAQELFYNGNQYTNITGGWIRASSSTSSGSTVSVNSEIEVKSTATAGAVLCSTTNKLNLADYDFAEIEISNFTKGSQTPNVQLEVHNSTAYADYTNVVAIPSSGVYRVSLEDVNSAYLMLKAYCVTLNIKSVYLGKNQPTNTTPNGIIAYSAPVGITVTATKGSENLPVSKTTIGDKELHCFIVKPQYFGEIAVACGDKVQTVTVDSNITVMLQHAVYLYKDGDECTDITGGWSSSGYTSSSSSYSITEAQKLTDRITLQKGSTSQIVTLGTTNEIDLTAFKKVYCEVSNGDTNANLILSKSKTAFTGSTSAISTVVLNDGICVLDIEAVNKAFVAVYSLRATKAVNIFRIWLE